MSDHRMQALEEKLAFMEDSVQHLNEALGEQQRQLLKLKSAYDVLEQKYAELYAGNSGEASPVDQKPPHY